MSAEDDIDLMFFTQHSRLNPQHSLSSFRIPRIDFNRLFVRLLDGLLGLPIFYQYPMYHVADHEGGQHLTRCGIHGAWRGELPTALEHHAPMLERRALPKVAVVHALVRRPPAPTTFLNDYP